MCYLRTKPKRLQEERKNIQMLWADEQYSYQGKTATNGRREKEKKNKTKQNTKKKQNKQTNKQTNKHMTIRSLISELHTMRYMTNRSFATNDHMV